MEYLIERSTGDVLATLQNGQLEVHNIWLKKELKVSGVTIPRRHWAEYGGHAYLYLGKSDPELFAKAFKEFATPSGLNQLGYVWSSKRPHHVAG